MEKSRVALGDAPALPPHEPAEMLDHYMTRYDYDYNRDPSGTAPGSTVGGTAPDSEDGVSGAVRNRPVFAHDPTGAMDGDTTYRVDYKDPERQRRMRRLVEDAYSVSATRSRAAGGAGNGVGSSNGGVYAREWFTVPGSRKMLQDDISTYKTDYTADAASLAAMLAMPTMKNADGSVGMYAGAPPVPYQADFLTVKSGAKEDDGADLPPKITNEASLRPKTLRAPTTTSDNAPVFTVNATTLRALVSSTSPPWVPAPSTELAAGGDGVLAGTATAADSSGDRTGEGMYSCESWLYGDTSGAHALQLPQGFSGSACENLLPTARGFDGSARTDDEDGSQTTAALLRRLAGRTRRTGATAAWTEDETNPIYLSPAEQRRCAVRQRLAAEGFVKGLSVHHSDYIDQGRLPELPGNPAGGADARQTNTSARATAGEMTAGQLTQTLREAAVARNAHGTLLAHSALVEKAFADDSATRAARTRRGDAAAVLAGSLPSRVLLDTARATEKSLAVDRADPHRHKLR